MTNAAGCSSVCSAAVILSQNPVCTITGDLSICSGESTQLCVPAGAASYLWSTGATTNCVNVNAAGTYSVTVTNAEGCSSVCSAAVILSQLTNCTITGNNFVCSAGQTTQLCVPAGATSYLWSTGATTNCIMAGVGTYSVTITNANGCSSICSETVIINPQPTCVITGDDFLCDSGQSTQLCVPAGAGSYLWSTGANTSCITVNTAGTYTVTVTYASGCTSVCSKTVTVNPLPNCTITGENIICQGQSTLLCVTANAASYLWSTGANTSCITVNTAGTYTVTVTNPGGCSSICSKTVTVNPLPVCSITGNPVFCQGQSTVLCVPAGAASYLWSTGASTNCITVNNAGTYSVTVSDANGCSSICSATVTASPLPICNITGDLSVCEGQSTILCASAGAGSYLWSTGATTNCISVNTAGTYTVTISDANGCSSICSAIVTTNPLPVCTITGTPSFCQGQSTILCATANAASYLWSTGATTNCITVSVAGTYSVTLTDENGCSSVCAETVTVNPIPICTISGNDFICAANQTTELCVPPGAASYLWSTGATTNCITVGAGTYTVTVTDENGCSSVCSETVIINPQPSCTITGNLLLCEPGQLTQLCVPPGAVSYLWSTGATTNCISVNAAGTYAVTVTYANGCISICSETVIVNPLPDCIITGDDFICQDGQLNQLCVPPGSGSYLWNTGATTNCIIASAAGTYTVTITNSSGCTSVCSKNVTVNLEPVCTITGDDFICEAGQFTQLCVSASGSSTYLWSNGAITSCISVSSGTYSVTVTNESGCTSVCSKTVSINPQPGCSITGDYFICEAGQSTTLCVLAAADSYLWSTGETTNCITVNSAGLYTVTVTYSNGCSSVCSKVVSVNPLPNCTITGGISLCEEGQFTQLCILPGGNSYLWNTGETTNCINISTAGTYSVTVTYLSGCTSVCSKIVTVTPTPVCVITCDELICEGDSTLLCVPVGADAYLWSTGATTPCITVNTAGTYSVTVTYPGGCTSVCSQIITVSPFPVCQITGNCTLPCGGQSTQICAPPGFASYWWNTGAMTSCISINTPGTYSVTVTNAAGCSSVCCITVTGAYVPVCQITGNCTLPCGGQPTLLCAPPGCASYWWNTGATTSCISVNTPGNYCVTVTYANGCSSVCSTNVTSGAGYTCQITGDCVLPCGGQPTLLCAPPGCASYWWNNGATTSCISVNTPGYYCVTVTYANGCTSVGSTTVTSGAGYQCQITGDCVLPCSGQPTLLCAPPGCASYWWNTGVTTSCISVNTPGNYAVTVTYANGCTSVSSTVVTNGSGFSCDITGNFVLPCSGQPTLLCAPPGNTSYLWSTGATTSCIIASAPGVYAVTVTNANGCTSSSAITVTQSYPLPCTITGDSTLCAGEPNLLCASPGFVSYLWSTGATTSCIIAGMPGIYTVTATHANGCSSTSSITIADNPEPICSITSSLGPDAGQSTILCAPLNAGSYLWSTGDTTRCITVDSAGSYSVTITNSNGCSDACNTNVTSFINEPTEWINDNKLLVAVYPNPFYASTTIEFQSSASSSHIVVEVCRLTGHKITTLFDSDVEQNKLYKAELNAENLPEGVYICRIVNGNQIVNKKLILIR